MLGEAIPGVNPADCPARPGYTTKNEAIGACTTYGSEVLLYNAGTAPVPNCDTTPTGAENRTWAQMADHYQPKVVVINTAGWEIVDRWVDDFSGAPDSQWGAPGCTVQNPCTPRYAKAAQQYSGALYTAINEFLSRGAKVVVATSPYEDGLAPVPDPNTAPAGLGCSWWEPYPLNSPTATGGNCTGNATAGTGGQWRPPYPGLTYRSGREKLNQINAIMTFVKTQYFGSNPNVLIFPFKEHFNGPEQRVHRLRLPAPERSHGRPGPDHAQMPDPRSQILSMRSPLATPTTATCHPRASSASSSRTSSRA